MQTAARQAWPERQLVQRQFTIRWTAGCASTRVFGAGDDEHTRWQIESWASVLDEVVPQLGPEFVTVIDTRRIGEIPRSLWIALMQLTAGMPRKPVRRALLAAEGWAGDNQAEAAQLVTAGNVRVFQPEQHEQMVQWLASAGTLDAARLRALLS